MRRLEVTYPFPSVALPARHFVALAAVVIVFFLANRPGRNLIDDGALFLLLSIVVVGSAWFAGTASALAVTVFGAVLASVAGDHTRSRAVETHLALFVALGLLLTALVAELRRARGEAERVAGVAHAARLEAEAASRTKDEFLGTISHELRTPLNAVLGWLHLIRTGKLDRDTERRGFEAIERNVRLQAQLTADLLDVSQALTGRLALEMRLVSLTTIISEAVSQVSGAAAAHDVTLDIVDPPGPVMVLGDPTRLRQVVWHLLANAIKFMPRGGGIEVRLDAGEAACITVRDTGPGIDPAFLSHVFERFTQADSSVTRASGGLGVGLSLARELIERHGGDIDVRNSPNGGAMFTIRLPLYHGQKVSPLTLAPLLPSVSSPPLDGVRVLLLDRDSETQNVLSVALRQHGASVSVASSVDEALETLESWRPDVLVSDAASPDRDMYALVGKVQSLEPERGGRIPALALTTLARTDEGARRMLSGVKCDLPKPVEPAILAAEIARLAGRERRHVER